VARQAPTQPVGPQVDFALVERILDFGAPSGKTIGWPALDGAQVGFDEAELRGPRRSGTGKPGGSGSKKRCKKNGQLRAVRPPVLQVIGLGGDGAPANDNFSALMYDRLFCRRGVNMTSSCRQSAWHKF